jgi:tetratricopeptide (TPR) repeat protein
LQAAGQLQQAVALIEQLTREATDHVARSHLTTRLAYLYLELGDLNGAQECLAGARLQLGSMIANREERDISACEFDVVEASISLAFGASAAEMKTRRALVALRRLCVANPSERAAEALCRALFLATRLAIHRMAFGEAIATSLEACHVLDRRSTGLFALRIEASTTLAYARSFVPGLLSLAIEDSSIALRLAEAHGLPRAAARIASNACSVYVVLGENELAVRFGEAAVQVTRALGLRDELAFCCLGLGAAYIAAGQARRARSVLVGVASPPAADQELAALVQLLIVDSYVAEGRFEPALANVGQVITAFKRLSGGSAWGPRYVGSALRMRADALDGLGDRAAARACIHESLSFLNPLGENFTLVRALRSAARITGRQAHLHAAQELTQALRA